MFPRLRALVQSLLEVFPLAAEVFGRVLSVIPLFQGVATSPVYIEVYYCNMVLSPLLSSSGDIILHKALKNKDHV